MKKNYIVGRITTVFLFAFQFEQAQSDLTNNQYGSLIRNWLDQNKYKHQLSENDLSSLLVSDSYFSKKTKINHVYVNQSYQGIKISNAISSFAVRDNYVFYNDNRFIKNIASKVNTFSPAISAQDAIVSVVNKYDLGSVSNLEVINTSQNKFMFNTDNISTSNIPVELVFESQEDASLNLVWDVRISTLNGKHAYGVKVNAITGDVIDVNEHVLSFDFGDGNHSSHKSHADKEKKILLICLKRRTLLCQMVLNIMFLQYPQKVQITDL